MTKRKKYTSEFKLEAVRLMESAARPSTPRQLGVRRSPVQSFCVC
jgi:transposase-like protein